MDERSEEGGGQEPRATRYYLRGRLDGVFPYAVRGLPSWELPLVGSLRTGFRGSTIANAPLLLPSGAPTESPSKPCHQRSQHWRSAVQRRIAVPAASTCVCRAPAMLTVSTLRLGPIRRARGRGRLGVADGVAPWSEDSLPWHAPAAAE